MMFSAVILSLVALTSADILRLLQLGQQIGIPRVQRILQEHQQKVTGDLEALEFYESHPINIPYATDSNGINRDGRGMDITFIPHNYKNGMSYSHPNKNQNYLRNLKLEPKENYDPQVYHIQDVNLPLANVQDFGNDQISRNMYADDDTPYLPYSPRYFGRYVSQYNTYNQRYPLASNYGKNLDLHHGKLWDMDYIKRDFSRKLNHQAVVPTNSNLDREEKPFAKEERPEISFSKKLDSAISRNLMDSEFIKQNMPVKDFEIAQAKPFNTKNIGQPQQIVSRNVVLRDLPNSNRFGWGQEYVSPMTGNYDGKYWDNDYRYGKNQHVEEYEIPYRRIDIGNWEDKHRPIVVSNHIRPRITALPEEEMPFSYDNFNWEFEKPYGKINLDHPRPSTSRDIKYIPLKSVVPKTSGLTESALRKRYYLN